jgi:hypothetical protein
MNGASDKFGGLFGRAYFFGGASDGRAGSECRQEVPVPLTGEWNCTPTFPSAEHNRAGEKANRLFSLRFFSKYG